MVGRSGTTNDCECLHNIWDSSGKCLRCGRRAYPVSREVADAGWPEIMKRSVVVRRRCADCGGSGVSKRDGKPCRKH